MIEECFRSSKNTENNQKECIANNLMEYGYGARLGEGVEASERK